MDASESPDDAAVETAYEAWRRRHRPENEIPASVPVDAAIGTSAGCVVFISTISVYTNGIEFTTEVRGRGGPGRADPPVRLVEGMIGDAPLEDRMMLGVELPDGRRCINTPRGQEADPLGGPVILSSGGNGSSGTGSATWFLSPLPPPGDLRLYCAWPSAGIPETTTVISADDLRRAGSRVRQLWPPRQVSDEQADPTL